MALLPLVVVGCGRRAAGPVAPLPPSVLPPQVVAVYPPPRATLVRYDTPRFWARFAAPLDTATVSARTVYLKLDDGRVRIAVRWEPDSNAILIMPLEPLGLLKTYTLELSPDLATAEHVPLGRRYWWQFTVNSLYEPGEPTPSSGATKVWPTTALAWRNDANVTPGGVGYDLYASTDSAAVARRAVPRLAYVAGARFVPAQWWPQDTANYWSLTAVNATTAERLEGPVWRFDTLGPRSTHVDSVTLVANQWGWASQAECYRSGCRDLEIISGPGYVGGVAWTLGGYPSWLTGVSILMATTAAYADSVPAEIGLWGATAFNNCTFTCYAQPYVDEARGCLATATFPGPRLIAFSSDALTSYVSNGISRGINFGFVLRTASQLRYDSPRSADPQYRPYLTLRYRVPNP